MISVIIFLLYMVLILVIPVCEYRKPKWYSVLMQNMSYTINGHRFMAYVLALLVIFFHLAYFAAFPANKGIMISTLFVFFLLSTRRTVHLMRLVNRTRQAVVLLAVASVGWAFLPSLFPCAVSLAFLLQIACILPPGKDEEHEEDSPAVSNNDIEDVEFEEIDTETASPSVISFTQQDDTKES